MWSLLLARRETDKPPNCASSMSVCLEVRVAGGEEDDNLRCTSIAPDSAGLTVWVRKKGLSTFQEVCTLASPPLNRAKQPRFDAGDRGMFPQRSTQLVIQWNSSLLADSNVLSTATAHRSCLPSTCLCILVLKKLWTQPRRIGYRKNNHRRRF